MTKINESEMVLSVLRDGQRSDRILRRADDGHLYTSPDRTFIGEFGPYTPPHVEIPVAYDTDEEAEVEWADKLIDELDEEIEAAE